MIKVFTTNKNGKIELTKEELKQLLDEAYWEGYRNNSTTWIYNTPSWSPYTWTSTDINVNMPITGGSSQTVTLTNTIKEKGE